jgi:predicted AlkP superfamily phosphohydrolase/phosphomutase
LARRLRTTRLGRWVKQRVRAPSLLDWGKSIAYQSGTGFGVSVNLKGREPQGIVEPADYDRVREEIRDALLSFRDLQTGSPPVENIWRREELYTGPYVELAPDLIIEWNELWDYQNVGDLTMRVDWPSGDHRRNGILAACGSRISGGSIGIRGIADIAATALAFCGVMPRDMDGRPIEAIVGPVSELTEVSPPPLERLGDAGLSLDEQESIAHHLRDLGYIE